MSGDRAPDALVWVGFAIGDFEPLPPARHADAYFGLLADLGTLFERRIDLVESAALRNPYRRREIEATQVLIHAAA